MSRRPRPVSPLSQRDGLDAVRYSIPPHRGAGRVGPPVTAHDALLARFPALAAPGATPLRARFDRGEIVRADGTPWQPSDPVRPGEALWFHRELAPEDVPDIDLPILFQDEHLLVIDKPHDVATMPRGAHVLASALARLRRTTGITTLTPLHRLDRRTAGVLVFGIRPAERAAYQGLFAAGAVWKEYLARVAVGPGSAAGEAGERFTMRDRLVKPSGSLTVQVVDGEPNAVTDVEVLWAGCSDAPTALLRLRPATGRTHQLRAQLSARGMPILGDDLYPVLRALEPTDPPLQLLARELAFTDPATGEERRFTSRRDLVP